MSAKVHPLKPDQARAVEPRDSVWLSASAGTGKTQVLSARVLRLLLERGVKPADILCLTFTKAGAAEMATRVNEVLARWVRLEDTGLAAELAFIGAATDPDTRARARTLFAYVLDCPGGGLRIDTIHAFAQWLLAAFPNEAGLIPGTRPMEDRDRELLAHRVLADLVAGWEEHGERVPLKALEALSVRLEPDKARAWLMRCAEARDLWLDHGGWQEPLRNRVEALLRLEPDSDPSCIADLCHDDLFDCDALRRCLEINRAWSAKSGGECAYAIDAFLGGAPAERLEACEGLRALLFTQKDEVKNRKSLEKLDMNYPGMAERVRACLDNVRERATLHALVDVLTSALTVGRRFAIAWEEAKQREGLVDFDDLIRRAAALLAAPGLGQWIAYKLDRRFDHILVDEAQDTNAAQWEIIRALTGDFFTGEGQADGKLRTIFVVGDYKQAIFGFQGTSPEYFAGAKARYAEEMATAARNAAEWRHRTQVRELVDVGLGQSYRTAQPVLDFVDQAVATIGPAQFGLSQPPQRHVGALRPGLVTLWRPVTARPEEEDDEDGPEGWLPGSERRMAEKIAAHVKALIGTFPLAKGAPRVAGPGDIMILVRKRKELAGLIVARLHAAGVPVAGVDRLRLGAPLAVKDLLAALRFAAQPLDDLSLANLLVSPLVGWSQEQLLEHGWRPEGVALWDHLRASRHRDAAAVRGLLIALLARADFDTPQSLLHWLLVGPWQGRRKLVARLGREVNDPVDELLNAALAYATSNTPSLQGFMRWFDAGEGELKRDTDSGAGLVRVMTVHGSKGLEAPIVILADATGDPAKSPPRGLALTEALPGGGERKVPLPDLRSAERVGPIAEVEADARKAELEEHWRLLYVAMTRAEEALFIGGALGKREREPAAGSWYARLAPLFEGEGVADPVWNQRWERGERADVPVGAERAGPAAPVALPAWASQAIGPEPRPPRPLAPSAAGEDRGADPPLPPQGLASAARRGVLLHRLLERLPDVPPEDRTGRGAQWLARNAAECSDEERADMLARALRVIGEPQWAELFGPRALAEVPLAATVGGLVIAGTADRLLIEPRRVLVADFKSARRPPSSLDEVPPSTLRQMAAYTAALAVIYPGRRIEAAVLYTQTPQLIALPPERLEAYRPGPNADYAPTEQSLAR